MFVEAAARALQLSRGSTCDLPGCDDDAFWEALQDAAHMDAHIQMDLAWESGEVGLMGQMELFKEGV
jgi:hypothetical protein